MKANFTVTDIVPNVFATQEPRLKSITLACDAAVFGVSSITLNAVHSEGAPALGEKLVFELAKEAKEKPDLPA